MALAKVSLDDKYALDATRAYMTGIEALVRLPILQHQRDTDAGLNTAGFISGYRGSPLGSFDLSLWQAKQHLDKHHIHFQPGVNEDLAATAVWGSQQVNMFAGAKYDGVFSMWYGKGPGVDRSMDAIRHANACGTSQYGGVLAIAGDDHACKSSTLPHQTEHNFIAASIPVLSPANVQEVLDLGIYGWELSRYSGCWVALKAITENMDSAISAEIDPHRVNIIIPDDFSLPEGGLNARWPDPPLEQELRLNKYKIYAARHFAYTNNLNQIKLDSDNPRLGIITSGKSYLDVLQALENLGIDAVEAARIGLRVYKLGMSWPLEPVATHAFAEGLEEILVVEEKRSIIEDQLTGQLYNWPVDKRPRVVGEFDEHGADLLPNVAELTPAMVARAIASRIGKFYTSRTIKERLEFLTAKEQRLSKPRGIIERVPHYCSGCPHNTSTKVPDGSRALAGIGCHYMVQWMDRETMTFTQMGGEGATWFGQAPFTETKHIFQNLGDGTYFHSGILAIRAAVAANVNITYKILFNDAVAMTGGQKVEGGLTVDQIVNQLVSEGVKRIAIVTDEIKPYPDIFSGVKGLSVDLRDKLNAIQLELRDTPGTTVILYDQTCAAEKRRRRKKNEMATPDRRIFINEAVCEGCGDCSVQSNCLSVLPIETELGRKRKIDQSACNRDYSCVDGFCPSFVSVYGAEVKKNKPSAEVAVFADLPPPVLPELTQPWNILVTGVGGTGVLTVGALLAMAAHIEGKGCSVLNQTGLAQKFGSVVSHVRIGGKQEDIHAVRVAAGDADLLLGCDLVVAASDDALAKLHNLRSHAVVNSHLSPTAEFINNPDVVFPLEDMQSTIEEETGADKTWFINATDISIQLLGDSIASNLFLLGYAWQRGLVPVSAEAINSAIAVNGVAVEFNQKAFLWGCRAACNEAAVKAMLNGGSGVGGVGSSINGGSDDGARGDVRNDAHSGARDELSEVDSIVADRYERLCAYQNSAYADDYKAFITTIRTQEHKLFGEGQAEGQAELLSQAVSRNLYKLMAYKDEYEVARLYTDGKFMEKLNAAFSGNMKLQFHMAPPLLAKKDPITGRLKKMALPHFTFHLFKLLAKLKFLRGSRLDLFGYSEERRQERQLIADYKECMQSLLQDINADNYESAVQLANLPEKMRGFGIVKTDNIKKAEHEKAVLLDKFHGRAAKVVRLA
ncbi:MAG: indolepyruvate ferredoxin oxidoreductase family protein [Pseudohongiellaceae bacterium]